MRVIEYKGGSIEELSASDRASFDGERRIKYYTKYADGDTDGHGQTGKYVSSIAAAKEAINEAKRS